MELLAAVVEELVGMDPTALADGETIVELDRRISQLQAVRASAAGAWDAKKEWSPGVNGQSGSMGGPAG